MPTRRQFLTTSAATIGGLTLSQTVLRAKPGENELVKLSADIEPIVRLIETTPREKCIDVIAAQLRSGLPYRQFLAALYLAGIRNVSPQPPGFKFHCVFVINAAHQLSLDAPVKQRLLPLFWALDEFKKSQAKDVAEGDFRLQPVTGKLPDASVAWHEFHEAMHDWDEARADRAIAVLARTRGAMEIQEQLWQYGARDYRNIGHKAIFVANTWRTLQTIGWRHAEPALRSLVLGLLDFGKNKRVNDYAFEDQSFLANVDMVEQHAKNLPGNWTTPQGDEAATLDLLAAIRAGDVNQACQTTLKALTTGKASGQAAWDAVHLAAGELMTQQQGIYGIHTVTSVNGLRYAYQTTAQPKTRLLMLLQAVGWLGQFHNFMAGKRQGLQPVKITDLKPGTIEDPKSAPAEILSLVNKDITQAAGKAFAFGSHKSALPAFRQAALNNIFHKANEPHYYKYPTAIFEDYRQVSSQWRPHLLATATYHIPGTTQPDNPVMQQAAEALEQL